MGVRRRLIKFFSHAVSGKRRGTNILISVVLRAASQRQACQESVCVKICNTEKRQVWCHGVRKATEQKKAQSSLLTVLGELPSS